jgi:choloylglycine hydrolase
MSNCQIVFRRLIMLLLMTCTWSSIHTIACSAFFWTKNSLIFGKNFDWYTDQGYLIKNNRGVSKYAYSISKNTPAAWTSKYGSVTFNQIGKEFPYGGINERGLVVEQLWLHAATYANNNNETLSELEWIQYQLDNFASTEEVIAHIHTLTIKPIKATVHYFVADKHGQSAVIDFIGGKTIIHRKSGISQTLTNTGYAASLAYYEKHPSGVDSTSRLSEDRFCQLSDNLKRFQPAKADEAFPILARSAEQSPSYKTCWTVVYDIGRMELQFNTYANRSVKTIRISELDFSNQSPVLGCELNADQFLLQPYTHEINKQLVAASLKAMQIRADLALAANHQFNPSGISIDTTYMNNYATVYTTFTLKKRSGSLYYTIAEGEQNFNTRRGTASQMIAADSTIIFSAAYAVPKGEYAIAAFHDVNANKKLDGGLFGIPKEPYAFSRNKKGLFGLPPKYKQVKFILSGDTSLHIRF